MRIMALEVVKEYRTDEVLAKGEYDAVFSHQASVRVAEYIRQQLGVPREACVHTHPQFGNTVSASVPLSMSTALRDGGWRRGDRTLVVVGAAGVSIGFASFTF